MNPGTYTVRFGESQKRYTAEVRLDAEGEPEILLLAVSGEWHTRGFLTHLGWHDWRGAKRYASGTYDDVPFFIQVSETDTLDTLKQHFRTTVGHDRIVVLKWFYAT